MLPWSNATLALHQFLESSDAVDFMHDIVALLQTQRVNLLAPSASELALVGGQVRRCDAKEFSFS